MKMMTATDLKNNPGAFFDALLEDGGVTLTRNGRLFEVVLKRQTSQFWDAFLKMCSGIPDEERAQAANEMQAALDERRKTKN